MLEEDKMFKEGVEELFDKEKYCPVCDPDQILSVQSSSNFCSFCGAGLAIALPHPRCKKCGIVVNRRSKFCEYCGNKILG